MSGWQARVGCGVLFVAVGGIWLGLAGGAAQRDGGAAARTPAPETLLPEGSVLYLGWDGQEAHQEAWEQTAAYEALYKSGLIPTLSRAAQSLIHQAGERAGGGGGEAKLLIELYEHLTSHGLSLGVALVGDAGPPQPVGVLVVHKAAKHEPALSAFLKKNAGDELELHEQTVRGRKVTSAPLPGAPGFEFGWWTEGEHLVVAAGVSAVNVAIDTAAGQNGRGNITKHRLWPKYRGGKAGFDVTT
ncbi:MAG TPA: hypothetical protein VML55_11715, partial [Planctomycetaceae bacterium]|nr:hypothetical protein [Planctomycetaceae bacterium]